ncbi:MAG: DUF4230 domain-containing protein [Flavobacteriales bacterium]|jgi:hypothetical protein|nr:DUF4230 domain-containing protein [Flavobacteriales bacterium]MBK6550170.1 DUF4230 domain-containing protein [Flavobacteriales bacterium]MBK6881668.1 DUF4230 domain-containing protein [Flavobacteriales bacterium]MBK7103559.1 DUF4230 domain-containing protein [Flavobacteriales bacterium]MBK7113414.1 DUF4230 domain-containing protein [Flavobacteriales bacterium]
MNRIKGLIILVAVALLVYFITRQVYEPEARSETISSTILLERVRPVLKLITVEGEFNEIYDSRSSASMFEILKSFTPFQKRALLRIKARVSVGYDMESMDLSVDDATRTVSLKGKALPEILSIEHQVDYYNIDQGLFNSFTAAEINRIEQDAQLKIRQQIPKSGLFEEAVARRSEVIGVIRALVEGAGWTFADTSGPHGAPVPIKQ